MYIFCSFKHLHIGARHDGKGDVSLPWHQNEVENKEVAYGAISKPVAAVCLLPQLCRPIKLMSLV